MSIMTMRDPVYFGGVDLNLIEGWQTTGTDPYRDAKRDVQSGVIAYTDLTKTTSMFYGGKPINVSGVITRTAREYLDQSISELKRILHPINQALRLYVAGELRQYNEVTVSNIAISDVAGGYAKVDIEFQTSDPYNYELITTEVLNVVNLTSGNKSYPVTFEGTAKQLPKFTITLDSADPLTNATITITNPITGESIAVEREWTVADVLIIDCKEKTCKVNDIAVDFTGNFLYWSKGAGFINYTDDFTERQVDINVIYTKRYE